VSELLVHQIVITREYDAPPMYILFERGCLAKPVFLLTEIEAVALRGVLIAALEWKPLRKKQYKQTNDRRHLTRRRSCWAPAKEEHGYNQNARRETCSPAA
jgi:hypothetical protein